MKSKLIFLLLTIIIGVLTVFLFFQFVGLAANTDFNRSYSRSIIAQIHLKNVQFVVNSDAISRGYFIVNLTFENPTNESLTLTRGVHAESYYYNSSSGATGWKIAEGWASESLGISPGSSKMALRMNLEPYPRQNPSFAIVPNYRWWIYYSPKLGTVSYQMTATVIDLSIQHGEPAFPQDEIYTVADTYAASIASAWILGFEIVAVSLIQKGEAQKSGGVVEGEKHNVMLSIIYAVQGLGIIAAQIYYTFIYVLIPPPPLPSGYIPYGLHGAAGIAAGILFLEINTIALAFLAVAAGLFLQMKWAMKAAVPISLISVIVLLLSVATTLNSLFNPNLMFIHTIALAILFSAIAIAHGIVVHVGAFKKPRSAI
jgi:hypothetical protein